MNMKQWIFAVWIKFAVKISIIFIFQIGWLFSPRWLWIIDDIWFVRVHFFALFPLFFSTKSDRHRQEFTIFGQQTANACVFQKVFVVVVDVQHDVCSAFCFIARFERIFWRTVAAPMLRRRIGVRFGENFHLFGYHKRRIETQSEMTNNGISVLFVFVQKIGSARKRNLIDVFFNLFGCHTHATVANG